MAKHNNEQVSRWSSGRRSSRCRYCSENQKTKVRQDDGKDNDDHSCPARNCPVVGREYFSGDDDDDAKHATAPNMSRAWSNPIQDPRAPITWQARQDSNGQWQYMYLSTNTTTGSPGPYATGSGYYTPPSYPYTMNASPTPSYSAVAGYGGSYNTRPYGTYLSPGMPQQFSPHTLGGVQYAMPTAPTNYYPSQGGNQNNAAPSIQIDACPEDQAVNDDDNYDNEDGEDQQAQVSSVSMRKSHSSSSHHGRRRNQHHHHHHHRHDGHYDSDNGHDRHRHHHHRHRD